MPSLEPGPRRRARIIQISDLHIGSWGKPPAIDQLRNIVRQENPDFLIVSGDQVNHPVPWAMRRAAKLVAELCPRKDRDPLPLMTLAGNHDYRLWGSFGFRRFSRVPFYVYFRENGLNLPWRVRWSRYLQLSASALWPRSKALLDPPLDHWDKERGFLIVGFNSNSLAEMIAAGKVDAHSLQKFSQRTKKWAEDPSYEAAYKIAVVHHHPAPIPFVATGALARIQESTMVLYNAGTLLRALNDAGFHLVLHGHKHHAGFSRISYATDPRELRDLAIAAAGSSAHPRPDDPRGNHLHVIDLFDDDTVTLESRFFDGEVTCKDQSYTCVLQDLGRVGRLRLTTASREWKLDVGELAKKVTVTKHGYSLMELSYLSCRVSGEEKKSRHRLEAIFPAPTYARGFEKLKTDRSPPFFEIEIERQELRRVIGSYEFGNPVTAGESPFDYGVRFQLINGHSLTPEEFERHYAGRDVRWEITKLQCDMACRSLRLEVEFPSDYDMELLDIGVEVHYLPSPLERLDSFDGTFRVHPAESRRIRDGLRVNGRRLVLRCRDPIPGFVYCIRWQVKEQEKTDIGVSWVGKSVAETGARNLVRLGRQVVAGDPRARRTYEKIVEALMNLASFLTQPDVLLQPKSSELWDLSLMVFDDEAKRLRCVALSFAELESLFDTVFVSGEGCAGFAFEKTRTLLYHPPKDKIGYFIESAEWSDGPGRLIDQSCMISVPWVYPGGRGPNVTVGVLNIGSRQADSQLIDLCDLGEDAWREKTRTLTALTAGRGSDIIDLVNSDCGVLSA